MDDNPNTPPQASNPICLNRCGNPCGQHASEVSRARHMVCNAARPADGWVLIGRPVQMPAGAAP